VIGLYTATTAALNLTAAIAALVGAIAGPWWLGVLGSLGLIGVNVWTVVYARRRPDLVAEAERDELERKRRGPSIG
jgi:hypothetical protein